MQQRIVNPLAQAGRAGDHHDGRFLGVRPGDRIAHAQAADAIRDAQRAHAVDAGVGVGREAGAILARAADRAQRALFEHRVERQDVVARDAEHVADAVVLQPADQVLADRKAVNCSVRRHECSQGRRRRLETGRGATLYATPAAGTPATRRSVVACTPQKFFSGRRYLISRRKGFILGAARSRPLAARTLHTVAAMRTAAAMAPVVFVRT